MDDPFDSSVNLEETHLKEGFDEGHRDGLIAGKEEGKQVGLKVGFEVGEELGFYGGCIHIWISAIQIDPTCFSNRAKMAITQMQDLILKYPLMDPEDLQVQESMDSLSSSLRCCVLHCMSSSTIAAILLRPMTLNFEPYIAYSCKKQNIWFMDSVGYTAVLPVCQSMKLILAKKVAVTAGL